LLEGLPGILETFVIKSNSTAFDTAAEAVFAVVIAVLALLIAEVNPP
jgi:hypothetical protein